MSKVYVLGVKVPYGCGIINIYSTRKKAEEEKKKIKSACEHHGDEMIRTDYDPDIDEPRYYGDVLTISSWTVK